MPALGKILLDEPIKEVELGKSLGSKLDLTWELVWNGIEFVKKWRLVVEDQDDLRGKLERGEKQEKSGEEFNFGLNSTASDLLPIPRFLLTSISKSDIEGWSRTRDPLVAKGHLSPRCCLQLVPSLSPTMRLPASSRGRSSN